MQGSEGHDARPHTLMSICSQYGYSKTNGTRDEGWDNDRARRGMTRMHPQTVQWIQHLTHRNTQKGHPQHIHNDRPHCQHPD
jgi:hypothetical protein